jgi:hypothetical protein
MVLTWLLSEGHGSTRLLFATGSILCHLRTYGWEAAQVKARQAPPLTRSGPALTPPTPATPPTVPYLWLLTGYLQASAPPLPRPGPAAGCSKYTGPFPSSSLEHKRGQGPPPLPMAPRSHWSAPSCLPWDWLETETFYFYLPDPDPSWRKLRPLGGLWLAYVPSPPVDRIG